MDAATARASLSALLVDGTALFFALRSLAPGSSLDYFRLDQFLKASIPGLSSWATALFFTSWDRGNDGQRKFLEFIESRFRWKVDRVPTHDAVVCPPIRSADGSDEVPAFIRFDSRISFSLGRLAEEYSHIVVLSDSFSLAAPMEETAKRGTQVALAFFGQLLDPRWGKLLRAADSSPVEFLDLDKGELFSGGPMQTRTSSGLSSLP